MDQRVSLITLGVDDLRRARAFYEALGWHSRAEPDDDVVFFQAGGMVVALWGRARLAQDSGVELGSGYGGVTLAYNTRSVGEVDAVIEQAALEEAIEESRQIDANSIPGLHEEELSAIPATYIYKDGSNGPLAPNITLTPEKAGEDLIAYEGEIQNYVEGDYLANLVDTVDAARAELVQNNPNAAEQEFGLNRNEVIANAKKDAEPVQAEEPTPRRPDEYQEGLDPETARALANPQIRSMLEDQVTQNESAKQQYLTAVQQAHRVSQQSLAALLPEWG